MSVLPSIRQILTILATETGVERYRAGDTTERALVLRYKDSRPACPEILQAVREKEERTLRYIQAVRHEASSNEAEGRAFPRLTKRSARNNATRRASSSNEHHP
ncbi:hypothetical protein ABBQ32_000870 [Trebouxia sp. C0010 RCD-2024]